MRAVENISQELFDKIRSRVSSIRLGDETGAVTTEPSKARFFEFNFKHRNLPVGAVTISLNEEGILQVYFPNSMVEDVDTNTADAWYGFLKELSKFSARNMLNYETHNVTKERLDKKDYQFLTQRSQDEVMENRMYGTSQKSFLEQGTAKLIIQHDKAVDETKMGARSRNIKAIYIENADGERFKFANNYLPGARAMARHVSNEGHTRDDRGQHIVSIMHEMNDLKTFVRAIKREDYVTDEQNEIIEAATDRYYGLKDTLKNLASANGYQSYFENWMPEAVEDEGDLDDLKEKLTRSVYDDRLTSALPAVRRAMEQRTQMREANDEEALKMAMSDEPIEIFDNETDMAEIKNYMQYIKNSDMEAQRKNQALVVAIVRFLVKNATDDNLANAMSEFDVENKKHMAAGYALAKKFIQGKYEVKQKVAKKDLYGKEKSESVTFESFEQSMNMISEGTWHLFSTEEEIKDFVSLLQKPLKAGEDGEDAINAVMKFIGDDDMLDDIAEFVEKNGANRDARPAIIKWLKNNQYGGRYRYPEQYTDAIKAVLAGLKGKAESVEEADLAEASLTVSVDPDTATRAEKVCADNNVTCDMEGGKFVMKGEEQDILRVCYKMRWPGNIYQGKIQKESIEEGHKDYDDSQKILDKDGVEIFSYDHDGDGSAIEVYVNGKEVASGYYDSLAGDMVIDGSSFLDKESVASYYKPKVKEAKDTHCSDKCCGADTLAEDCTCPPTCKHCNCNAVEESKNITEMMTLKCKDCGDMLGEPTTDCPHDSQDPKGDNWIMVDVDNDGDMDIAVANEEIEEVDEAAESLAKLKAMAGVGSKFRSNHGIHEGEEGYQITPRSIVARELRKLQDIEKGS